MAYLSSQSPRGQLFLGLIRDGRSLNWSARSVGVHLWVGYRWLGEWYGQFRVQGLDSGAALERLGCRSVKAVEWEERYQRRSCAMPRHHLAVEVAREQTFWAAFGSGVNLASAAQAAGVGRSTAYRWWQRRFLLERDAGVSVAAWW